MSVEDRQQEKKQYYIARKKQEERRTEGIEEDNWGYRSRDPLILKPGSEYQREVGGKNKRCWRRGERHRSERQEKMWKQERPWMWTRQAPNRIKPDKIKKKGIKVENSEFDSKK